MSLLIGITPTIDYFIAAIARKYPFLDFWSSPTDKVTIPISTGPLDIAFPNIIVSGLPALLTIRKVALVLAVRALNDTSGANNYINAAAKTLRIKKSGSAWAAAIVGITFAINSLYCKASIKEAGPVIIGSADLSSVVTVDDTYNVRGDQSVWHDAPVAAGADLELYDVQVGLRVYYS